ncbi:Hypothetical protein UVM_LOCUS501 [uncultured virus]|nr:Hypothetical protein UVM_LOCUS501 [uncultured virus]
MTTRSERSIATDVTSSPVDTNDDDDDDSDGIRRRLGALGEAMLGTMWTVELAERVVRCVVDGIALSHSALQSSLVDVMGRDLYVRMWGEMPDDEQEEDVQSV